MSVTSFLSDKDNQLNDQFLSVGYVIQKSESPETLEQIRQMIRSEANQWLLQRGGVGPIDALNRSHQSIAQEVVNDVRLHLYARLNSGGEIRKNYFSLASSLIQTIVGNELAMQNKV
ncbi:MAG: hypothetical protein ACKPCO_12295, partial [Actinomycetota bacterium]